MRNSQKSAELSLTSIPWQVYTQKQTHVYEARSRVTFDDSRYTGDHHWLSHRYQWMWPGRKECTWKLGHVCAQELCPRTAAECRSCTSVLGLARLSFQERKVMRTCATAVGKQYSLALRSAVSVYHSLKSLTALQTSMRHTDSLPRCLFFFHVHYFLFRGEGMCICNG